jgi:hypothetical protein
LDGQLALTINDDSLSAADIAFGYKCSHRVGRQIGRARCQQLVQLQGLGRVLLGRRAGPIDDRPVVVHEPLARLARLLFVEQRAGKLLHPRRCCAVASADSRLSACAMNRSRSV